MCMYVCVCVYVCPVHIHTKMERNIFGTGAGRKKRKRVSKKGENNTKINSQSS